MSGKSSEFGESQSGVCWGRHRHRWFKNKTFPISTDPDVTRNLPRYHSNQDSELSSNPEITNACDKDPSDFDGNHNSRIRMNPDEDTEYVDIVPFPKYDQVMAKQRASIKWLLSKAYNNQTPDELLEPFYKDHQGEEHLKPFIVKGLSDAELYCRALCNLYADPNYSQLSPWGVVQAMARKGSYVQAPLDVTLTETVLIQNRPLRINAHMALIEAMMVLHVRELISPDRVLSTVQRYGPQVHPLRIWFGSGEMPSDTEEAFLLWINRAVLAIKEYIQTNNLRKTGLTSVQLENWNHLPLFQDFSDLGDGIGLCALVAFYCPDEISFADIVIQNAGEPLNVSESLWNLQLLQKFCRESLPFNVLHFTFEDLLYFNESLKQNLFSFLADIFNLMELKPCSIVKPLGSNVQVMPGQKDRPPFHSQSATSTPKKVVNPGNVNSLNTVQIHDRKKSTTNIFLGDAPTGRRSPTSSVVSVPVRRSQTPERYVEKAHSERSRKDHHQRYCGNSSEDSEEFVVHRGRNVPTLSQVIRSMSPSSQDERSSPGSRISYSRPDNYNPAVNIEDTDNGIPAAGRPTSLGAHKTSYAGRRSRRNSFSEADSQLTLENFGGSQEKLNRFVMERNPDKQPAVVTDNTPSPIRYPKRNSGAEHPEDSRHSYSDSSRRYGDSSQQQGDRSAHEYGDRTMRKERTTSSSDDGIMNEAPPPFWGRKKPMDTYGLESSGNLHQNEQLAPQFMTNDLYGRQPENMTVYVVNDGTNRDGPYRSTSMSNLSRLSDVPNKPLNIVYLQNNSGNPNFGTNGHEDLKHSRPNASNSNTSSQGYSPSTGLQGQSRNSQSAESSYRSPYYSEAEHGHGEDFDTEDLAAQLASIRLKLEEKRKRIEMEKGRMETIASRNQSKLGKAAYLKAINKGREGLEGLGQISSSCSGGLTDSLNVGASRPRREQLTLTDLESKWLDKPDEACRTPEIESMDPETYQRSLAKMDTNLSELESDIGRLSIQQEQFQKAKNTFFLHGDSSSSGECVDGQRKSWGNQNSPAASIGRSKWGPPRPTLPDNPGADPQRTLQNGHNQQLNGTSSNTSSFRLHTNADSPGNRLFNRNSGSESSQEREIEERPTPPPRQRSHGGIQHAPLPTPPPDDMEPQSVSFVQDENTQPASNAEFASIASSRRSLQITSGSKTYRITPESGSPPRPSAHRFFKNEPAPDNATQGFYIPLDEAPKGPKPPVRTRRVQDTRVPVQDLSSAYVSSIVDKDINLRSAAREDDNEYESRLRFELDEARVRGELVVDDQKQRLDSVEIDLMEKKKEKFLLQSLKRQQQVEEQRRKKEQALQRQKEEEAARADEKERKKEEEKLRKQAILESYRMKKQEDMQDNKGWEVQESNAKKFMRPKSGPPGSGRQRPKTIHLSEVDASVAVNMYGQRTTLKRSDSQSSASGLGRSVGKRGSNNTLYSGAASGAESRRRDPWGSTSSLNQDNRRGFSGVKPGAYNVTRSHSRPRDHSTSRLEVRSRRDSGSYLGSQDFLPRGSSTSSLMDGVDDCLSSRCSPGVSDTEKSTPVKLAKPAAISIRPGIAFRTKLPSRPTTLISPTATTKPWPGSLPSGLAQRRNRFDDGASDISSVISSNMDYSGLRLYKQPTAKSNRSIILNAVEYCVFPGAVNRDSKNRVLDEINQTEAKHFLIMFRDAGCQFRAIYAYSPETDEIVKLYGTGPRAVTDAMFEKFFKYNSGGKCFSQVHTKHLTVTIDAFTIHNSLWTGKKAPTTKTKDMTLVI